MPRKYKKVSNRVSYTNEQFEAAKEALKNTNIRKVVRISIFHILHYNVGVPSPILILVVVE